MRPMLPHHPLVTLHNTPGIVVDLASTILGGFCSTFACRTQCTTRDKALHRLCHSRPEATLGSASAHSTGTHPAHYKIQVTHTRHCLFNVFINRTIPKNATHSVCQKCVPVSNMSGNNPNPPIHTDTWPEPQCNLKMRTLCLNIQTHQFYQPAWLPLIISLSQLYECSDRQTN